MKKVYVLACCGMLSAMGALLAGPLGFKLFLGGSYALNLSFGYLPGIMASVLFSPWWGLGVGIVTDIGKMLISPMGAYDPMLTLSFAIVCMIPGFIIKNNRTGFLWVLFGVALAQIVGSVVINNVYMIFIAKYISIGSLPMRLAAQAVLIPCNSIVIFTLLKSKSFLLARRPSV